MKAEKIRLRQIEEPSCKADKITIMSLNTKQISLKSI